MKTSVKIGAVLLFASTLFLNLSFDASGHLNLFQKAKAENGGTLQLYNGTCSSGKVIKVCAQGTTNCTPSGTCP